VDQNFDEAVTQSADNSIHMKARNTKLTSIGVGEKQQWLEVGTCKAKLPSSLSTDFYCAITNVKASITDSSLKNLETCS